MDYPRHNQKEATSRIADFGFLPYPLFYRPRVCAINSDHSLKISPANSSFYEKCLCFNVARRKEEGPFWQMVAVVPHGYSDERN